MIASKVKDSEKTKLLDRFNFVYSRLTLSMNSSFNEEELFNIYCEFIKNNSNLDNSYLVNINGFVFQNDDDKKLDEKAISYLQTQINQKEKDYGK